jgi:hypothetical protein
MDDWYVGSKGPEWVVTLRRLGPGDLFRRRVKKVAAAKEGLKKEKQELLDLVKEQHTGEMTEAAVKKLGPCFSRQENAAMYMAPTSPNLDHCDLKTRNDRGGSMGILSLVH